MVLFLQVRCIPTHEMYEISCVHILWLVDLSIQTNLVHCKTIHKLRPNNPLCIHKPECRTRRLDILLDSFFILMANKMMTKVTEQGHMIPISLHGRFNLIWHLLTHSLKFYLHGNICIIVGYGLFTIIGYWSLKCVSIKCLSILYNRKYATIY